MSAAVIHDAGGLRSILSVRGCLTDSYGAPVVYESERLALAELVAAGLPDESCLHRVDGGWLVYGSEADRREDEDGSNAKAMISEVQS